MLLVLVIIFPSMIGVIFYTLSEQRREARIQAQETALRIARLSAREQERLITGAHYLLMTLAVLPEVRERTAAKCSQLFASILKKFPYYTNVGAVTPQGDIFCSGLPNGLRNQNIADREYFQEALKERDLGISHVLVGRMSGKPNISIAYPSFDPDGSVHAVVFVGLDLTWLKNIAATAQLPARANIMAIDEKGVIFVRYPEEEMSVTSTDAPALVRTIIERKEGFTDAEGSDGVRRLYGFTTLHRFSKSGALFVSVGIPHEVAFANSNRIFYDSLVVILFASLLAAAGTWLGAHLLIRRQLENLIAAAHVLGEAESNTALGFTKTASQFDQVINEMRVVLQKATDRQADFAAMIAHDFRNPIHVIEGAASLLPELGQTKHDEKAVIDMIRRGCVELTQMLNEFLDFSKYKAGYLQLEKQEFDLTEFFRHAESQYSWQSQQKGILLQFEVEPGIGLITADRKKLRQLLDNLFSNALKFTKRDGEIRMGARQIAGGIELWVRDTGMGITPTEMNRLFSGYHQTNSARSSDYKGTGLGLLICKMIVETHGGKISAQSEPGKGTIFRVWLPRIVALIFNLLFLYVQS